MIKVPKLRCVKPRIVLCLPVSAGIYLLQVNNRNTRTKYEICSKLTIKTPEWCQASFWYLCCELWTNFTPCSSVSVVNFEHVIAGLDFSAHQSKNYQCLQGLNGFFNRSTISIRFQIFLETINTQNIHEWRGQTFLN